MRFSRSFLSVVLGFSMMVLNTTEGAFASTLVDALERTSVISSRLSKGIMLSVALAGDRLVAVGERGYIGYSDDNGVTWIQVTVPVSVTLTAVRFINASHGWVVGHSGVVLATSDGGLHWQKVLNGIKAAELMLSAANSLEGTRRDSALTEANQLVSEGADKPFFDVYFTNENTGLVVGAYGLAFRTEDGGRNWIPVSHSLPNSSGSHLYRIVHDSEAIRIVGERGLLLKGNSISGQFVREELPYKGSLFGASCTADRTCYVYGLRGTLLQHSATSSSWLNVPNDQPATITAAISDPNNTNLLIVGDQAGRLMRAAPGAVQLSPVTPLPLPPINSLAVAKDGGLIVATVKGMVRLAPAELNK